MKISDALKKDNTLRVVSGDRWIVFDSYSNKWIVYEKPRRKHHTQELGKVESEDMAVDILLQPQE